MGLVSKTLFHISHGRRGLRWLDTAHSMEIRQLITKVLVEMMPLLHCDSFRHKQRTRVITWNKDVVSLSSFIEPENGVYVVRKAFRSLTSFALK